MGQTTGQCLPPRPAVCSVHDHTYDVINFKMYTVKTLFANKHCNMHYVCMQTRKLCSAIAKMTAQRALYMGALNIFETP